MDEKWKINVGTQIGVPICITRSNGRPRWWRSRMICRYPLQVAMKKIYGQTERPGNQTNWKLHISADSSHTRPAAVVCFWKMQCWTRIRAIKMPTRHKWCSLKRKEAKSMCNSHGDLSVISEDAARCWAKTFARIARGAAKWARPSSVEKRRWSGPRARLENGGVTSDSSVFGLKWNGEASHSGKLFNQNNRLGETRKKGQLFHFS